MAVAPVDVFFIGFPGNKFNGQIAPAILELVDSGTIRVIDALFVSKNSDGVVTTLEVAVLDAETGRRWPIWVEIDSNATDPSKRALEIHPAVNFASGHRYIVALRNLRNAAGERIEAPSAFRYYRDRVHSKQPEVEARRKHFESVFKSLKRAGMLPWLARVSVKEPSWAPMASAGVRASRPARAGATRQRA